MRFKKALLSSCLCTLLLLGGCSDTDEKPTETAHVVTVGEIKSNAKDYDSYYLHTLLRMLAEQHEVISDTQLQENLKLADEYYAGSGLEVEESLKEVVVKARLYEELVFLRIMGISYEDLQQSVKDQTHIYQVYQFLVLDTDNRKEIGEQLEQELQGVVDDKELQSVYMKYLENKQVEMTSMPFIETNLPSVFSEVASMKIGDTYTMGDDTYVAVVHLQNKKVATLEDLITAYKQYVTSSYPDTMKLIQAYLDTLPEPYVLGEGVEELIYQEIDGLE